jgi:type VI secretion system protein
VRERSLLDRLRDRGDGAVRSARENPNAVADSVLEHLRRMLNTRQGISCTVPDYGIPDLTDMVHSFPEAVDRMRRSIRSSIEKYEPRLKNVQVEHVPEEGDPFQLCFEIKGQIVTGAEKTPVAFHTTLDASGRARVGR